LGVLNADLELLVDFREPIVEVIGGIVILAAVYDGPSAGEKMGRLFKRELSIGIILKNSEVPSLRL
jgi:hypothetical protein